MVEEMKLNVAIVVFGYRLVKIEPMKRIGRSVHEQARNTGWRREEVALSLQKQEQGVLNIPSRSPKRRPDERQMQHAMSANYSNASDGEKEGKNTNTNAPKHEHASKPWHASKQRHATRPNAATPAPAHE
jgi:hypothetical protein